MEKSKLSKENQLKLIEHFVAGTTARTASAIVSVNKTTASFYFYRLRELICKYEDDNLKFDGEIEVDVLAFGIPRGKGFPRSADRRLGQSYFGGKRKGHSTVYRGGKIGRGASGKIPVFGLLKRCGKVYVKLINSAKTADLLPIIKEKVKTDSIVYTDTFRSYNVLDVSEFKHFRINHATGTQGE